MAFIRVCYRFQAIWEYISLLGFPWSIQFKYFSPINYTQHFFPKKKKWQYIFFCLLLTATRFSFSFIEYFSILFFFIQHSLWDTMKTIRCNFELKPMTEHLNIWPLNGVHMWVLLVPFALYCITRYFRREMKLQCKWWTGWYWSRMCEPWWIFDRIQKYANYNTTKCHRWRHIQRSRLYKRTQENRSGKWHPCMCWIDLVRHCVRFEKFNLLHT